MKKKYTWKSTLSYYAICCVLIIGMIKLQTSIEGFRYILSGSKSLTASISGAYHDQLTNFQHIDIVETEPLNSIDFRTIRMNYLKNHTDQIIDNSIIDTLIFAEFK